MWRFVILFLLVWSAIGEFFFSRIPALSFLDEVIVLGLLAHLVLYSLIRADKGLGSMRFSKTDLLIVLLVLWTFGSFLVNGSSLGQCLRFLLSISKGFILFYWIKRFLKDPRIINDILTLIKWLILIQVPFFVIGLLLYRGGYFGDFAVGAMITGDASSVATFFWLGIMICIARFEQSNDRRNLLFGLGLAGLLIVTSTKQLTVLLPVVLLYLYGWKIRVTNIKQLAFIAFGVVSATMLYSMVERSWMTNFGVDASEVNMLDYMDESEKLLGYYSLLYELPEEIRHPITWGAGPGMYGSYTAMNARTHLSQKYIMYYYDLIPEGLGGTLAYRSSSIIGCWGDIGLVGLIIVLAIYIRQTFLRAKRVKAAGRPDMYNLIIACGFLLLAQSFILNVFEGNTFTLNLFWILCGISAADIDKTPKDPETELCA